MEEKKPKVRKYVVTIVVPNDAPTKEEGKLQVEDMIKNFYGLNVQSVKYLPEERSLNQNAALHLWLDQIAEEAEKRSLTIDMLIKKPAEVPITAEILKDFFRFTGKKMYGKKSTAKLSKEEFSTIVNMFDKSVIERLGIDIEFPNIDLLISKDNNN